MTKKFVLCSHSFPRRGPFQLSELISHIPYYQRVPTKDEKFNFGEIQPQIRL